MHSFQRAKSKLIRRLQLASLQLGFLSLIASVLGRSSKARRRQIHLAEMQVEIATLELEMRRPTLTMEQMKILGEDFKLKVKQWKQKRPVD